MNECVLAILTAENTKQKEPQIIAPIFINGFW
jgi:hypothetical protein